MRSLSRPRIGPWLWGPASAQLTQANFVEFPSQSSRGYWKQITKTLEYSYDVNMYRPCLTDDGLFKISVKLVWLPVFKDWGSLCQKSWDTLSHAVRGRSEPSTLYITYQLHQTRRTQIWKANAPALRIEDQEALEICGLWGSGHLEVI